MVSASQVLSHDEKTGLRSRAESLFQMILDKQQLQREKTSRSAQQHPTRNPQQNAKQTLK